MKDFCGVIMRWIQTKVEFYEGLLWRFNKKDLDKIAADWREMK